MLVTTPGGTNAANTLYTYLAGSVTLSPLSDVVIAAGQTGRTVTVTANAPWFAWTATANAPWLTIAGGTSNTGSGTVIYTADANTSVNSRTGTLTIGGQTLTITQSGVTGSVTLSPVSYAAPFSGAVGRAITVTSNATDFAWTATSNTSWLTITGGGSGRGNGTVTYSVAANAGSDRAGTLSIGGRTFTVSQSAKPEIVLPQVRVEATFVTEGKATPLMVDVEGTPGLEIKVGSLVPWLEVAPKILTLPGKLTITPSAQLNPGIYLGIVAMQAEGAEPAFLYVRLTVIEQPQFVALPTTIQLDGSGPSLLYITSRGRQVRYEAEAVSEGGWLSVQPESGITPANLRVTANTSFLKPGTYTGSIRVRASEGGGGAPISVPVSLTIRGPAPAISSPDGVVNSASFAPGLVSGAWTTIFGTHLAKTIRDWTGIIGSGGVFPTSLGGVSVTIDGKAAFVSYVSPSQLNVQVPDLGGKTGPVSVVVKTADGETVPYTAIASKELPGLFAYRLNGKTYAAAVRLDSAVLGPDGASGFGSAKPGETVLFFGTGFGPTSPAVAPGKAFSGAAALLDRVAMRIGGVSVTPAFAGLSSAGLYQFNVTIPDLPTGEHTVEMQINGLSIQNGVILAVQR
ncbi:MAG: BACON domain-containing protein [Pseudomonadota bacterium]